ncbi:hypothetical protein G6L63_11155 [Agrobacterium vitis]|uniref:hypothetical protein n=1 Tax=Agrobacterium vitis TaxID=373 RepID=UPI0012E9816C|nr:hypothetical protein [Agrobacterium vitis]MVA24527.1 hypothetical protein [Agrobacterium vitis]NSZ48467.1 hypothetical protein [Agrobacterium vitis]UJL73062.1 hypothetical protein AVCG412_09685 [Agrobacterium vitis]
MKISLKRKIGMTAAFAVIYVTVCVASSWIIGVSILHLLACALLAIPFAWMITQTWSDD